MLSYRVYWLDQEGRIKRGDWLDAEDDDDAYKKASELCEDGADAIQIWQATRPVDEIECHPAD